MKTDDEALAAAFKRTNTFLDAIGRDLEQLDVPACRVMACSMISLLSGLTNDPRRFVLEVIDMLEHYLEKSAGIVSNGSEFIDKAEM